MTPREQALLEQAILAWGEQAQYGMVVEEIGELLTAMNHWCRKRCHAPTVAEEIADVQIMLDQLALLLGHTGPSMVKAFRFEKILRLERRLKDENINGE
jgi:NTP pyrophosphatase (non-canonical NTP hydrolase)